MVKEKLLENNNSFITRLNLYKLKNIIAYLSMPQEELLNIIDFAV
jgi:hypothetical protein